MNREIGFISTSCYHYPVASLLWIYERAFIHKCSVWKSSIIVGSRMRDCFITPNTESKYTIMVTFTWTWILSYQIWMEGIYRAGSITFVLWSTMAKKTPTRKNATMTRNCRLHDAFTEAVIMTLICDLHLLLQLHCVQAIPLEDWKSLYSTYTAIGKGRRGGDFLQYGNRIAFWLRWSRFQVANL